MTPPAGREHSFRLVALGDSITVGVGDTVGRDAVHGPGWAAHLATVLGAETFTNLATEGARSRDVVGTQLGAALALRPHLATVLVGGNDVLRSDFDARHTLPDVHRSVNDLCRAGADVVLVLLPVIGLFELCPRLVRRVMRRRVASINAAVAEVAGSAPGRVVVVDAARAIAPAGSRAWHIDRVHPSPLGHRCLALAAAAALSVSPGTVSPGTVSPGTVSPGTVSPGTTGENGVVHATSSVVSTTPFSAAEARRLLPEAPDPPSTRERLVWLLRAGLPWCVRRGRDFLPGLLRAVVHDLRAERAFTPGGMVTRSRSAAASRR